METSAEDLGVPFMDIVRRFQAPEGRQFGRALRRRFLELIEEIGARICAGVAAEEYGRLMAQAAALSSAILVVRRLQTLADGDAQPDQAQP